MTQLTPKELLEWLNPAGATQSGAYRQLPKHVLVQAAALIEKLLADNKRLKVNDNDESYDLAGGDG